MIYPFNCSCGSTHEIHQSMKEPLNTPSCRSCGEVMRRVYVVPTLITDPLYLRDGNRPQGSEKDRSLQRKEWDKQYESKLKVAPPSKNITSAAEIAHQKGLL